MNAVPEKSVRLGSGGQMQDHGSIRRSRGREHALHILAQDIYSRLLNIEGHVCPSFVPTYDELPDRVKRNILEQAERLLNSILDAIN